MSDERARFRMEALINQAAPGSQWWSREETLALQKLLAELNEKIATLKQENEELSRMVSLETMQSIEIGKLRARVQELDRLKAELAKAQDDKAFWEKYGQTRMMDLVEARAEIHRLKESMPNFLDLTIANPEHFEQDAADLDRALADEEGGDHE